MTAFRYSLPVLKIYSIRNVHCRLSVLAVNIFTTILLTTAHTLECFIFLIPPCLLIGQSNTSKHS